MCWLGIAKEKKKVGKRPRVGMQRAMVGDWDCIPDNSVGVAFWWNWNRKSSSIQKTPYQNWQADDII